MLLLHTQSERCCYICHTRVITREKRSYAADITREREQESATQLLCAIARCYAATCHTLMRYGDALLRVRDSVIDITRGRCEHMLLMMIA